MHISPAAKIILDTECVTSILIYIDKLRKRYVEEFPSLWPNLICGLKEIRTRTTLKKNVVNTNICF